jgi:hypothetical protein
MSIIDIEIEISEETEINIGLRIKRTDLLLDETEIRNKQLHLERINLEILKSDEKIKYRNLQIQKLKESNKSKEPPQKAQSEEPPQKKQKKIHTPAVQESQEEDTNDWTYQDEPEEENENEDDEEEYQETTQTTSRYQTRSKSKNSNPTFFGDEVDEDDQSDPENFDSKDQKVIAASECKISNPERYYTYFTDGKHNKGKWNQRDLNNLKKRLIQLSGTNWTWGQLSMGVPGRTGVQCQHKYFRLLKKNSIPEEYRKK